MANVLGRISALKLSARQNAKMDVREGADKMRALGKHMKAIEPALKKLQRRLEKARKAEEARPPAKASETSSGKKSRTKKAKKAEEPEPESENDEDLLSKLDAL